MLNSPIIFAYQINDDGSAMVLQEEHIPKEIKENGLAWVHLDLNNNGTEPWLRKEIDYLDPFIIDALLAEETRPRITEIGEGAIIILRGVNLNENATPEDMISIRLWVDAHRIISVQKRPLKAIQDIRHKMEHNKSPKDSGDFITLLIQRLLERMSPTLSDLEENLDAVEEDIIDHVDTTFREKVTDIRRQSLILRRYIAPQKDVIGSLKMSDLPFLKPRDKRSLQENYDQNTKFVEDLDALRERSAIVKDEITTILSDRLNKNLYILSVISAVFLPLGCLTGLLGVNIGGIPGTENPHAFYIFSGFMLALTVIQILVFKKLKWF